MSFALSHFVPSNVISELMIADLRKNLVFANLIGVSTPDQIGRGASYKIPGVGAITVRDYAGSAITVEEMADIGTTVTISEEKYFAFYADYVDNAETARDVLPLYIDKATYSLASAVDAYIAAQLVSGSAASVTGGAIDETDVLDWFADCVKAFDTNNVPTVGRWVVVPPVVSASLLKANVITNQKGADLNVGSIANVFGIDVYVSNNLKATADITPTVTAIGGVASAANLVMTLRDVESVVAPTRFATIERGLVVFGAAACDFNSLINSAITL